ncbi:MAG TPA: hypothetical protein VG711_09120 [Phycisphaerales bacterium]|nr:hypothetical protein [Phycisphaerales bacterium]
MRILVDDQVVANQHGTPAEIVELARQAAEKKGRWIVEVRLDGQAWSGAARDLASVASSVEELSIRTQDPRDLMRQVLQQAAGELERADRIQRAAAGDLQAGKIADAMSQLGEAIEVWQTVQRGIELGASAGMIQLDGAVSGAVDRLRMHLETLRSTIESNDTSALADELLYEMPGVVQEWRSVLCDLDEAVRTEA